MNFVSDKVNKLENFKALDRFCKPLVEATGKATQPIAIKNSLSGTWLGHQLHPLLTDLPIGAWVAAGALDLLNYGDSEKASQRLIGLGIIAAIPTAAAGASDWSQTNGAEQRVGYVHALGNMTSLALQSISYLLRRQGKRRSAIVLSTTGLGIVACAGYLGGHLTLKLGVGVNHTAFESTVTEWTKVTTLKELKENVPTRVSVDTIPVVLILQNGKVSALSATCVHAGGPLNEGEIADGCIRCPWHSSSFRTSDGKVTRGPAAVNQPTWEVQIVKGSVQVRSSNPQ